MIFRFQQRFFDKPRYSLAFIEENTEFETEIFGNGFIKFIAADGFVFGRGENRGFYLTGILLFENIQFSRQMIPFCSAKATFVVACLIS